MESHQALRANDGGCRDAHHQQGGGRILTALAATAILVMLAALGAAAPVNADVDMTAKLALGPAPTKGVKPLVNEKYDGIYHCANAYATIANVAGGLAIGNCPDNEEVDVEDYGSGGKSGYAYGAYFVNLGACAWVKVSEELSKSKSGNQGHCSGGIGFEYGTFYSQINSESAEDGYYVVNRTACEEFANVRPWSSETPTSSAIRTVPAYEKGTVSGVPALKWRYVTRNGKWVMVRDTRIEGGSGNWVFVPRSCLPATLPGGDEALPPPPTATTGGYGSVTSSSASLAGSINPNGVDTHYYIEWGREASKPYENFAPTPYPGEDVGSGTQTVNRSVTATGLATNTVYYYRLVASSPTGTSEGGTGSFRTSTVPPTATTEEYSNLQEVEVQEAQVTLNGAVNPNSDETHYYFQYGLTTSYGSTSPAPPGTSAGSSTTPVHASTVLTGLPGGTVYHYRLVATNANGEYAYGNDRTVDTPLQPFIKMQIINGTTEAVVEGPNHSLVQHWSTSEGWKTFTIDGENTTYSSPEFVVNHGTTEIFVQGPNHTLMQYWSTSEGWKKFQVTGANEVYSNPVLQEINGTTELVVQGPNHSLVQHWSTSEGWKTFTIDGENTTYSSPEFVVNHGTTEIFVQGPSHALMQYWSTSEGWKKFQVTGSNEVYSNPVLQENHGTTELVVQGPNHSLVQHWSTSEGWKTFIIDGEGTTYSSPQFTEDGGINEIFVQGPNHTLMQYWSTSEGWKKFQVTGSNEVYSNPLLEVMSNNSGEVYVEGPNDTLVQHWMTSTGWGTFTVANNAFS